MAKKLAAADAREVERAARDVPGVAFAEVVEDEGRPVLRIVLWQDAPLEETAALVELALRDALGVDVEGGDVRLAGFANASRQAEAGDMRVIDLGGNTWATEPIEPAGLPPLPSPAAHRTPALLSITVTRGAERCSARVEIESARGVRTAESSGPATEDRVLVVVAEATAHAAAAACEIPVPDVELTRIDRSSTPALAIVVVRAPGGSGRRNAGAALVAEDAYNAIATATLQAVACMTNP